MFEEHTPGVPTEKSFVDKTMAKEEIERIRGLLKRDFLDRSSMHELRNLLVGFNLKLVNFDDNERILVGLFLNYIENLFLAEEELYQYVELIKTRPGYENSVKLLNSSRVRLENTLKFYVDVYLYIINSSLAVGAVAFNAHTTGRYEYVYHQPQNMPEPKKEMTP
ncbi:MAG: hypothetical protein QXS90_02215 [Candidatus Diapherotrites archaeon]